MLVSGLSTEETEKEYLCFYKPNADVDLALKVLFFLKTVGEGKGVSSD